MYSKNTEVTTFKLKLPDGRPFTVDYCPKWVLSPELNHRVDHFEFRGEGVSSTGYYSHFTMPAVDYEPSNTDIVEYINSVIQSLTGQKYQETTQLSLVL